MVKKYFYQQLSIEENLDAAANYEDDHYEKFYDLLFYQLLLDVKKIPFENIIQNHLQYNKSIYKTKETNSLIWFYTADRKLINSRTAYSFRFANACHPEFYKTFETAAHHLFLPIAQARHRCYGWYEYTGQELLNDMDRYLNIERVVQNQIPHETKLFINQKQERLDIKFHFHSIKEEIAITFEPGPPFICASF